MLLRKARLTLPAIIMLVLLRLAIGWHFFQEGAAKVREGGFSSIGFLSAAKGPFAEQFHSMIPDYDGAIRTDPEAMNAACQAFAQKAANEFKFSEEQKRATDDLLKETSKDLAEIYYIAPNKPPGEREFKSTIDEYRKSLERVHKNTTDPVRTNVISLRKQRDEIESKWRALGKPFLSEIDFTVKELERRVNEIPTDEQAAPDPKKPAKQADGSPIRRFVAFKYPGPPFAALMYLGEGPLDVQTVDKIIPIFDMVVGILLVVGLLTPLAALAAGLFLASVVATQMPGYYGSQPTYYQAIEMFACFVLAATDAGRYAGIDYLPWSFWNRNAKVSAR